MVVHRAGGREILSHAAVGADIEKIIPWASGPESRRYMRLIWADEGVAPVLVLRPKDGAVLRVKIRSGSVCGGLRYQKHRHLTPALNGEMEAKIRVIVE